MSAFWKIAVIGSGPAGFYATGELFRQQSWSFKVDMFDRLPTPYGLVRGGVAPDHQKIKSVAKIYNRIAENKDFRFFGNVEFGKDIFRSDILEFYDLVIYAVGSPSDRSLKIPGEELPGSHSATEFVAWYNGHPDFSEHKFNLSAKNVFVIGMGNVALDVARILAKTPDELSKTDIADYALEKFYESKIENIWLVGRRGPLQAAFTPVEVREFLELKNADVMVEGGTLQLDVESQRFIETTASKDTKKNYEILKEISKNNKYKKKKRVHFLFLSSPIEILGSKCVEKIRLVRNVLVKRDDGTIYPKATGDFMEENADLIFRSIGYHGNPLPEIPFDQNSGTIPNECGQIIDKRKDKLLRTREYVTGWIKRGPTGVIGTNKQDAVETVNRMLKTIIQEKLKPMEQNDNSVFESLLKERNVDFVSFEDWKLLDEYEINNGNSQDRPRIKVTSIERILEIIQEKKRK
ncbi:MAG: NADP oxidoreductase [Deltaproteobacteria bacterium]|nr:NADP oxidoreductase [Deltaproteobacteria bacterium]|tara:strand:- start:1698 stop:3089 length:1392 start_codon:yes stop_codon:yes gene_type:complete